MIFLIKKHIIRNVFWSLLFLLSSLINKIEDNLLITYLKKKSKKIY